MGEVNVDLNTLSMYVFIKGHVCIHKGNDVNLYIKIAMYIML